MRLFRNSRRAWTRRALAFVGLLLVLQLLCGWLLGMRINLTNSVPPGLYIPSRHGSYVTVCLSGAPLELAEQRHYVLGYTLDCPDDSRPLLKQIIALNGDRVFVDENGIHVNGILLHRSKPLTHDSLGRQLQRYPMTHEEVTRNDQVWVFGRNEKSYDSRYYGPVPATALQRRYKLAW